MVGAQHAEHLVRVAQVGRGVLHVMPERSPAPRARARAACVTRASTGSPPRSRLQATRTPRKSRSSGPREHAAGLGDRNRRTRVGACHARSAAARRLRPCAPSGPAPTAGYHALKPGQAGTRPAAGRKPTTLQKLAGLRSDPPRSEPSAIGTMPQASATAAPPLLPPQVLLGVPGIARGAEHRVEGLRAGAELRRVGLADREWRLRRAGARR